jgi:GTP cyclohydrolase I
MATRFNSRKMEAGVKLLLEGMGMDNNNPDFKGTPKRVAKLYREMLSPKRQEATVAFPSIYAGMVILRHHLVHTMCPHHLLPHCGVRPHEADQAGGVHRPRRVSTLAAR